MRAILEPKPTLIPKIMPQEFDDALPILTAILSRQLQDYMVFGAALTVPGGPETTQTVIAVVSKGDVDHDAVGHMACFTEASKNSPSLDFVSPFSPEYSGFTTQTQIQRSPRTLITMKT